MSACLCFSFLSIHEIGIQNKWLWLTQAIRFLPFEKGRQCSPRPEQDISFESKNNWFCPSTRNRNYLKMYPLLWQPGENLFLYLPFDLSWISFYCLPHFYALNFYSLLQCPSDFPPLSFLFSPVATSFPNSSHMLFRVHKTPQSSHHHVLTGLSWQGFFACLYKKQQEVAMTL